MIITDHINLTGTNPLVGPNLDDFGPRFPDMSTIYDKEMQLQIKTISRSIPNLVIREGVYLGVSGPSYETPAEIRMFHSVGADTVGMSTIYEAIVAVHMGMKVGGISCLTNKAAGMQGALSHDEVLEITQNVNVDFSNMMLKLLGL